MTPLRRLPHLTKASNLTVIWPVQKRKNSMGSPKYLSHRQVRFFYRDVLHELYRNPFRRLLEDQFVSGRTSGGHVDLAVRAVDRRAK